MVAESIPSGKESDHVSPQNLASGTAEVRSRNRALISLVVVGVITGGFLYSKNANSTAAVSDVKADEEVILFPTSGHLDATTNEWQVDLRGWIFEPEREDWVRGTALREIKQQLDVDESTTVGAIFTERVGQFLVDNERGKKLVISLNNEEFTVGPSESNGHFQGTVNVQVDVPHTATAPQILEAKVVLKGDDNRVFANSVLLIPAEGVSVISDIDDTIKISNVRDRDELLRRTLFTKFEAVPGMSAMYQQWSRQGAAFHYVSNSPWQLSPAIELMIREEKFPIGTVHLRQFRLKDGSFIRFLTEGSVAKRSVIENLLKRWPERTFVLVGDSGEQDPEVYGAIARAFPKQIAFIAIRNATDEDSLDERFKTAFQDVPATSWALFKNPAELRVPTFPNAIPAPAVNLE